MLRKYLGDIIFEVDHALQLREGLAEGSTLMLRMFHQGCMSTSGEAERILVVVVRAGDIQSTQQSSRSCIRRRYEVYQVRDTVIQCPSI